MSKQTIQIPQGATEVVVNTVDSVTAVASVPQADVAFTIPPTPNQPPVVNAGGSQTITLPTNSVVLNGSANDTDGTIASYQWTIKSGGLATIQNPTSAVTQVTSLSAGVYTFTLKATDDDGASTFADTVVTVNPAPNQPPTSNAGSDKNITLPTNSTTLNGSGTDGDGSIQSYAWSRVSGPTTFTFSSVTVAAPTVSNLVQGTYVFRLTVTDNNGATAFDDVSVVVNPQPTPPPTGYTLVYSTDYESPNDLDPFNHGQAGNGSISTENKFNGTSSFKALANNTNTSSGWRSEIQYNDNPHTPTEGAWEFYMYIVNLAQVTGLYSQFHGGTSGTSGQGSLWIQGGKFMMQRNTCGTAGCPNIYQGGTLKSVQTGKWYKIRHEIKFSTGNDGYWRLYIDDQLYYDSGSTKTCDGSGQYFKIGINLFDRPNANIVAYFDALRIYKKS